MIWHITQKELLVNLLSLRFSIGLVVVALMMGIVGYILTEDYAARHQTYLSDVQRHRKDLEQTKVYSTIEVIFDIPPSPLSVFSRGVKDLPTSIRVSPYHVPSLLDREGSRTSIDLSNNSNRPYNPLLRLFASIDLSFVISMILSLFAILLVFDSFSGEREQGTLKLLLSGSVGRMQLLIGKFFGALLTMAVPLTLGFLIVMLIWSFSSSVSLDASGWAGIWLIYLFSLLLLAGFLALGLLVSLFTTESSSGLMFLLLVWVIVAVVIPEGGGYLAEYARPRESQRDLLEQLESEFYAAHDKIEYQQRTSWSYASMNDQGHESIMGITAEEIPKRVEYNKQVFPLKFKYAEDRYRVLEQYIGRLQQWRRMREALIRPSLCLLYRNIANAISGADMGSYDTALRQARAYRDAMMNYLRPKVATPQWFTCALEYPDMQPTEANIKLWNKLKEQEGKDVERKIFDWDRVAPVDLTELPQPKSVVESLVDRVWRVRVDILLLVGMTGLFFGLATRKVLSYRP